MQTMKNNIQDAFSLTLKEWAELVGKKIHLGVGAGHIVEDAIFHGLVAHGHLISLGKDLKDGDPIFMDTLFDVKHIRIELHGQMKDLSWGDIFELWSLGVQTD